MSSLNGSVLVLNQSYEPITLYSVKRAITMLFQDKVQIVETVKDRYINAPKLKYPCPSVIKLNSYVKHYKKGIMLSKRNILKRDGHKCQYCLSVKDPLTVDHVIPKVRGGKSSWENLVTACFKCNNKKGNKTPLEANMKLHSVPTKPHYLSFIQKHVDPLNVNEWKPYIFMS